MTLQELQQRCPIGSTWRHCKGGVYIVLGHYRDEASGEYGVLYSHDDGYGTLWGRLVSSWFGAIGKTTSGEDVLRFVRIDGEEAS